VRDIEQALPKHVNPIFEEASRRTEEELACVKRRLMICNTEQAHARTRQLCGVDPLILAMAKEDGQRQIPPITHASRGELKRHQINVKISQENSIVLY